MHVLQSTARSVSHSLHVLRPAAKPSTPHTPPHAPPCIKALPQTQARNLMVNAAGIPGKPSSTMPQIVVRQFNSSDMFYQLPVDNKVAASGSPEAQGVRRALDGYLLGSRTEDAVPKEARYQELRVPLLDLLKKIAAELPRNAGAKEAANRISEELQGMESARLSAALFAHEFKFEEELAARPAPAASMPGVSPARQDLKNALEACRLDRADHGKYSQLHDACYALLAKVFHEMPSSSGADEIVLALSAELEGLDQFSLATLAIILRENQFNTSLVETRIDDQVLEEFGFSNGPPHMQRTTKFSPEEFLALLDKLAGSAAHDPLMPLAARGFTDQLLRKAIMSGHHYADV